MKAFSKVALVFAVVAVTAASLASLFSIFVRCGNLSLPAVTDTVPPPAPVVLTADASRCRSVTLTWKNVYDIHSVLKTYRIYNNGTLLAETHGAPQPMRTGFREYRVTGLNNNTPYNFSVSAVDIHGNESPQAAYPTAITVSGGSAACTDTTPPTRPTGFSAVPASGTGACRSVAISLSGPSTDAGTGVDHYVIYRDGIKIASTNSGNYGAERFGLVPRQSYDYWETAVDGAGNESAASNVVHYTVPDCATVVSGGDIRVMILAINLPGYPVPSVTMNDIERLAFGWTPVVLGRTARSLQVAGHVVPPESLFNQPNMKAFYKEETYGRVNLVKAGVVGWVQLTGNVNQYCTQFTPQGVGYNCNFGKIKTDGMAKAASQFGWNPATPADRYILVINGQAQNETGGNTVNLSDFDLGTAIHEMGHTFGIEHGGSWVGRKFGAPVGAQLALPLDFDDLPFGAFDLSEYGDPRNRMGGPVINHFSAFQKELMGTLPASQVAHASHDTDFTLDAIEQPSTGFKVLRIPVTPGAGTGKAPFVIAEYRNGKGYDANASQGGVPFRGVQLRLVPDRFCGVGSDAVYVGELTEQSPVFTDWHRRMKYTLVSVDDSHAVLRVCGLGWELSTFLKAFFSKHL